MKKTTFLFIAISCLFGKQLKADTYIMADDAAIQYTGRIDFTNPKRPTFSFPGISIKAKFAGTNVSAVIKDFGGGGATTTNYYNVLIDDVPIMKLKALSSDTLYLLAIGLSNTTHTVELVKRTESSVGKSSFYGFVIPGTGSSLLSLPAPSSYKIEFIGDSWTCGYGNEVSTMSPATGFHSVYEDNGRAWGYIVAKKFDAQYHATSISGRGMYRNNNGATTNVIPDEFNRIFAGQSSPVWNFSNYVPDLVVIHLGTNDWYPQTASSSILDSASYVNKYIAFIDNLRTQYGTSTKIVCAFGNSISDGYPSGQNQLTHWRNFINAVVAHFTGLGDNEVYKFELNVQSPPYGEDWHPTIVTHNQMANQIAPYITTITGRTASGYVASTTTLPTTATSDKLGSTNVNIYPIPSSGKIHLDGIGENTSWSISDASGRFQKSGKGEEGNIEELESGIYFLKIGEVYLRIVKF